MGEGAAPVPSPTSATRGDVGRGFRPVPSTRPACPTPGSRVTLWKDHFVSPTTSARADVARHRGDERRAPVTEGLSLRGITKRFGTLVANDHIDLDIVPGRIHCLLGENGAGKSTLMNQLYGLLDADEGTISIDGVEQHFSSPKQSMAAGIGMVHQHFMLVPVFTVAENIILGREQGPFGALDMRSARARVRELSDRYHLAVQPDIVVERLPIGVQQRVEILKSLANDAKYLIFDEPTAVLTPAGDRRPHGRHALPARRGPGDRVHHPQAPRGA